MIVTSASPTNSNAAESAAAKSSWAWPPFPVTFIAAGSILVVAVFANFPAVEATGPTLDGSGRYGPHFELTTEYQHGWPVRYVRRKAWLEVPGYSRERASPWTPWRDPVEFSWSAILIDALAWLGILFCGALLVQMWRSRRRSLWQLRLVDLLGMVTLIGVLIGWGVQQRNERREEHRLWSAARRVPLSISDSLGGVIPAWLPDEYQKRYLDEFGHVLYFTGDAGTACQFPHLLVLQSPGASPEFAELLRRMPQLEALDLFMSDSPQKDEQWRLTSMRDPPPMPNLRGINLYERDITDANLIWLSKCPRLECIELRGNKISDIGLEYLTGLNRLRILNVSGDAITDRGCQLLAQISSLESLYVDSFGISDAGLAELSRLKRLKALHVEAAISDKAIARLRQELPDCQVSCTIITAR
ncbi:MAG TPA: hypothetical protein VFV87_19270 [Pirellulaceae bacterium]|nr:hypothetical protein [Pirellulaceae bacterium]